MEETERKSQRIAEREGKVLFSRIARRYDLANDLQSLFLHRLWKKTVVKLARVGESDIALDICCGTGDIAFELVKCRAKVIALDWNIEMLNVARARISRLKLSNSTEQNDSKDIDSYNSCINFVRCDAQSLPFFDAQFDAITIGYGLRNLPDWQKGIAEMMRVCKPGGRIVVLDFGKPDRKLLQFFYYFYLRRIVPLIGKIVTGDYPAYAYIYKSLMEYPGQHKVCEEFKNAGARVSRVIQIMGGAMAINYVEK